MTRLEWLLKKINENQNEGEAILESFAKYYFSNNKAIVATYKKKTRRKMKKHGKII